MDRKLILLNHVILQLVCIIKGPSVYYVVMLLAVQKSC